MQSAEPHVNIWRHVERGQVARIGGGENLPQRPRRVATTPDLTRAYVTTRSATVVALDAMALQVQETITLPAALGPASASC